MLHIHIVPHTMSDDVHVYVRDECVPHVDWMCEGNLNLVECSRGWSAMQSLTLIELFDSSFVTVTEALEINVVGCHRLSRQTKKIELNGIE